MNHRDTQSAMTRVKIEAGEMAIYQAESCLQKHKEPRRF